MSVYSVKGKGWRYDFILNGTRHTRGWFKLKREAVKAATLKKEKLKNPTPVIEVPETSTPKQISQIEATIPIDMDFLELINKRLDYVKAYNSDRHYADYVYMARRWVKHWKGKRCSQIDAESIRVFLLKRLKMTSAYTANKELRYLRATFNFAMHPSRDWLKHNPTRGIDFFPVEKRIKYVPSKKDVLQVILAADQDTQDYLWTIALTLGRMSEINRLKWQDVDFQNRSVALYTRKKRGGNLTPRRVPMMGKLHDLLWRRYQNRNKKLPWVFWHRYWDQKACKWTDGPFKERTGIMKSLCKKVGVQYFRFHALRHFGASMLDQANVPIGSIQRLLGHENRTTTEIYLHSIGESERQAMAVLEERFEHFSHTDSHTESHTAKKGHSTKSVTP